MRWRFGVVLCLFAAYVVIGCREPLTPTIDRNQAPETWITAAPMDTITWKDSNNRPTDPLPFPLPQSNTIPVRFHVYWAGADKDGAVAGFYWAVVETLPRPLPGQFLQPSLPGPKPKDYHYTTKTDSFFVFNVAEDIPDRQHAFFIYAVDNQGKPDATPARFIFNAQDRFPPIPIFEMCRCVGTVYALRAGGGVNASSDTTYVTDIDDRSRPSPRDTCPSGSSLYIKWHAQIQVPQTQVIGYRYKLDEPRLVEVGPNVTSVTYNSGIPPDTVAIASGVKLFQLRVVDQAFGTRDSTRRFQLNYAPDTWFAGPDPNSISLTPKANGERYATLDPSGHLPAPITGSLLSDDSVLVLPALRRERNTFFEIWEDTIWVRSDGDTVHMNSWVVLSGGGFDRDSRYGVRVNPLVYDPDYTPVTPHGPVLTPGPANGSPIGFRSRILMSLAPTNQRSISQQTTMYPIFDPNDVFHKPVISGYHPVFQAGRAFATMQAEDADGDADQRVDDGRELVLAVEDHTATPAQVALRSKVMTFYVDKPPYFQTETSLFRPSVAMVDTFTSSLWDLRIVAADDDPYIANTPPGGPSAVVVLRRKFQVRGKNLAGQDFIYVDPTDYLNQQNVSLLVPPALAPGPCKLDIELCDCVACGEASPGSGRCVTKTIDVYYKTSAPAGPASLNTSRPGSEASPPWERMKP